jgi:hypothetical protein
MSGVSYGLTEVGQNYVQKEVTLPDNTNVLQEVQESDEHDCDSAQVRPDEESENRPQKIWKQNSNVSATHSRLSARSANSNKIKQNLSLPDKVFICDFSDFTEQKGHKVESRDSIPRIEGSVKVPEIIPKSASQGPILPTE